MVTIYRTINKGTRTYVVSYYLGRKRQLKTFIHWERAKAEAKSAAARLAQGEMDVLQLKSQDRVAYVRAVQALQRTGVPLELATLQFAQAWEQLAGRASVVEAVKEYARRHLQGLPQKTVTEAVADMLLIKEQEGTSDEWLKVLKLYLNRLAAACHCQLSMLTTSDLSDFISAMPGGPRTKNNARQVLGAFFNLCRQRGWLPKDHEGISLLSKLRERPSEIQIFSPWEMAQFLNFQFSTFSFHLNAAFSESPSAIR